MVNDHNSTAEEKKEKKSVQPCLSNETSIDCLKKNVFVDEISFHFVG